jgi:hypothetical protein
MTCDYYSWSCSKCSECKDSQGGGDYGGGFYFMVEKSGGLEPLAAKMHVTVAQLKETMKLNVEKSGGFEPLAAKLNVTVAQLKETLKLNVVDEEEKETMKLNVADEVAQKHGASPAK